MSEENVERLQSAIEAFNGREGKTFDRLLAADAEIVPVRAVLEGTTYRGHDAGSQYCAAVDDTWESLRWEVDEIREVGDVAVAVGHIRGKGRETGAAIDTSGGWVAQFDDGVITHFRTYTNREEALEAAGLSEEPMGRESVESLRRAYDEWARGDFSRRELFDPNIEGVWAAELPDAHVDQGVEAFFASCREWLSAWEGFRLEAEAFLPAENKIVVLVVLRGKGKGSGAEVATPAAHVWTMRRGKAIRVAAYMDRAKAFEAAGLSE